MISLKIKRLCGDARLPEYATDGSGCMDVRAIESVIIESRKSAVLRTGLAFEIPQGFVLAVFSRSGHGFNSGVRLANCIGIVDSDYRGELKVKLANDGERHFMVNAGDRVAQIALIELPRILVEEVSELSDTVRGQGGFGSTGN